MSVTKKTVSSLKWTLLERIGVQGFSFAVRIALARILLPEEFGIVATVTIILVIASVFIEGGMGSAIIQHKDINRIDVSTVFMLNVAISILLFVTLYLASPFIADFYEKPVLGTILPVLAVGIVISALGKTQMQMLEKNLEFKRLFKITLPSTLISGIGSIAMALTGFGIWALVGQNLIRTAILTACIWVFCNPEWRPRLEFSFASLKKLAGFSIAKLTVALAGRFTKNLSGLIIAKAFSMQDLGFYNRAHSFQKQPVFTLNRALNRVLFPVFSEIQNDNSKLRSALRRGIPMLAFVVAPVMFWLITVAHPLIIVLLTEKWEPSTQYLRVFPLLGIIFSISSVKNNVCNGKGLTRLILYVGLGRQALQLITLFFTWRYGIMAMLVGQICCAFVNMLINDFVVARVIQLPMRLQIYDWIPYVLSAVIACGAASLLNLTDIEPASLLLFIQSLVFATTYLAICWMARLNGVELLQSKIRAMVSTRTSLKTVKDS